MQPAPTATRVRYEAYMASPQWRAKRQWFFRHRRPMCAACLAPGRTAKRPKGRELHVHHLTYERLGAEQLEDLIALCVVCHAAVHRLHNSRRGRPLAVVTREYVAETRRKAQAPVAKTQAKRSNKKKRKARSRRAGKAATPGGKADRLSRAGLNVGSGPKTT